VIHALIPAAGLGARFGGAVLKQYLPLCGEPVLAHVIDAITLFPEISGITVVVNELDQVFEQRINPATRGISTVIGGATRAESVFIGLEHIQEQYPETQWVLVHDAARPCLPRTCLEELLMKGLASPDGAILAVPVQDTLKSADESGYISGTVKREGLWAAQTPQLFPLQRLLSALGKMLDRGESPTDESRAMEHDGAKPLLVMGSPANLKITWPGDLAIAEAWLQGNGASLV